MADEKLTGPHLETLRHQLRLCPTGSTVNVWQAGLAGVLAEYDRLTARVAELEREREELREALVGVTGRASEKHRLCWCSTIAGLYCVGQPKCRAAHAALLSTSPPAPAGEGK